MKSIYVVMHHRKDNIEGLACQLVRALTEAGITVFAEPWLFHRLEHRKDITLVQGNPTYCEAVLSVGGDGTFLRANTIAVAYGLPILGINLGTVGFWRKWNGNSWPKRVTALPWRNTTSVPA